MSDSVDTDLRGIRVIYGAMLLGTLLMVAVFAVLRFEGLVEVEGSELDIVGLVAAGVGAVMVPAAFVARSTMRGRIAHDSEDSYRVQLFNSSTVMYAALLEGGTLFNAVAFLIVENPALNIGVAAVIWAIMAATFPTRAQFDELGRSF